jgi:phosphatidylserine/phosphatidylglycerophosphate/cardiolipin synthase-like enzyme
MLHAKAIVADDAVALVTSANLTGHALAHNIELGLLVHDRVAASGIAAHVTGLMREGTLARFDG